MIRAVLTTLTGGNSGGSTITMQLAKLTPDSEITHARSDFPAVAARFSGQNRILWDVRSLWADQKRVIQKSFVNDASLVTSASSTPNLSTMIFLTLDAMSDIVNSFVYGAKIYFLSKKPYFIYHFVCTI